MSRVHPHTVRVAVVGNGRVEDAFAEWGDGVVDVESADATALDDGPPFEDVDCVVVDGGTDGIDAVEAAGRVARRTDCAPAVALTDGWDGERVADAVSAGVAEALPRTLVDEDPDALVERTISAADDEASADGYEHRSVLFENNPDPVVRIRFADGEPVIRAVNPAFESVFGFDAERVVGESLVETLVPEADRPDHERIRDSVRRGEPLEREATRLTADGSREFRFRVIHFDPDAGADTGTEAYVWYTDITERRELAETYREVFENVSDGLVIHHPETGEILDANERFCEMNGYDRETLRGETVDAVTAPELTYEDARERIGAAREEGPQLFEWRNERADGGTFPVEVHLSVVEIHGEERVLGSVRDISARRRTERRLSEVLDRIDEAIHITTGSNLTTSEGHPDYLSSGYEELWGQSLETIRNRHENGFFDTIHPDDRDDYRAFVEGVADDIAAGTAADSYDIDYRIERADGEVRWIRSEYYPIEWDDSPSRVVIVSRDITERKRVRRNLRMIAERVDEAIYMASPDKTEVHYASPSFEDLWDLPIERVYEDPQAFFDRIHPDDREWFHEEYDRIQADLTDPAREAQDTYELEYRVRHRDGEVRWISVRGYPVYDEAGAVDRWIAVNRDVTERKARERRIASFDDATEDLATVDSPGEAAAAAVDAATEELALPAVGAFLYDDADGHLGPEAIAGALPNALVEPVGPGDGPIWTAFAEGTAIGHSSSGRRPEAVAADTDAGPGPLDDLAGWRVIPLGTHGVLLVGSPEGSFESGTVQTAHVLAATLEAALAHLRGQQRLADQEQELRTQTERADRLDRIARLTRRVEAALTDATTPGEIERAVCDRLAASGPYDIAWIGGVEVGSDRLTPQAVAGESEQYVEGLGLTTATAGTDPHPAVAAWRTDEVRVVDSLVGGGPASEWRQRALSAGFQSVCAVPLSYNGVTHGVLTVGTDAPNAVSDRERETLSQLGTSIANALAAIERRRALESDETVELEFRGPGESLPFARAADAAGCRVTLQRTVARQDGPVSVYFRFEGDVPDDAPAIARRVLPGRVEVVAATDATLVEARTDEWFGAPLAAYGGTLREASADPESATITIEVPGETDVRSFVDRLQRVAPSLELVAKRQHGGRRRSPTALGETLRERLTDRQLEALRTALSAGYFEWPREHDSSEVARRLDITQPTFNKHLRIAERETFELLFDDEG